MHIKKAYKLLLIILSYILLSSLNSLDEDERRIINIKSSLDRFYSKYPQQKVYLHLNKSSYVAGENIWFKAYVVDGINHLPDTLSSNLYIELITSDKTVNGIKRIRLVNGFGYGEFILNDTVPEGLYQIRSYTNWMRNFNTDYYFTHNFTVSNPGFKYYISKKEATHNKRITKRAVKKSRSFDIQFFPEGGDLVDNIESVVGFKAINKSGKSIKVKGEVYDSDKNRVVSFNSFHNGMGSFRFKPEINKKYYALVTSEQAGDVKIDLPKSLERGVVMTVDNINDNYILIDLKSNRPKTNDRLANEIILTGQVRGKIFYSSIINLASNHAGVKIEKDIFPTGILQFTVFSHRYAPLAERLVFINHYDDIKFNINVKHSNLKINDSLQIFIDVLDARGNPLQSNISLSLLDAESVNAYNYDNSIVSNLLLTSDLKGYIENPGYYFQNNSDKTRKALDYLMLTQGWRRFIWKEVINNEYPEINHDFEKHITIEGRITSEFFNIPLKDCNIKLTILDRYNDVFIDSSGEKGYFKFNNMIYYDTVNVKIEAWRQNDRKSLLIVLPSEEPAEINNYYGDNKLTTISERDEKSHRLKMNREIKKAMMEKEKEEKEINKLESIYGEPDFVITSDEISSGYSNVLQVLQGRVAGVSVIGNRVTIRGVNTFFGSSDPLYLIDGISVSDVSAVLAIPVEDVDRIEILKGPRAAIFGSRAANGVIAVYTKRGTFMIKGVIEFEMLGYSTPKNFYQPKYSIKDASHKGLHKHSTVFWEPDIQTGSTGKAKINLNIPDTIKKYQIIIEGVSYQGHPGSANLLFEIKNR